MSEIRNSKKIINNRIIWQRAPVAVRAYMRIARLTSTVRLSPKIQQRFHLNRDNKHFVITQYPFIQIHRQVASHLGFEVNQKHRLTHTVHVTVLQENF